MLSKFRKNLNHEIPLSLQNVYKKYKFIKINLILIDSEYEDKYDKIKDRLNNIKIRY